MAAASTFTFKLSSEEQDRLLSYLANASGEVRQVPHTRAAMKFATHNLALYKSGKLVLQGKGSQDWIEFTLEPEILQRVVSEELASPAEQEAGEATTPRIGIDESGKGDFFGPLVIAACFVDPAVTDRLQDVGIKDSKAIKSDTAIAKIAEGIRSLGPCFYKEISISPKRYNELIGKFRTVNRLLAWGHATSLEDVLGKQPQCTLAIADQFGPEHQIRSALQEKGKSIELRQRHKAESDLAVAAASILARDRFVRELNKLSERVGSSLPKGATHVRPTGEEIVKRHGPVALWYTAKCHFRTTKQVLEACGYSLKDLENV